MILRQNPNADGADLVATATGAANRWDCVDDGFGTEDDDTTYLLYSGGTNRCGFRVPGGLSDYIINEVRVEARWRAEAGGDSPNHNAYVRLSTSYTDDAGQTVGTSYANFQSAALARPGGGSWALADFNDSSFNVGVRTSGATTNKRTTRINLYLDVTPLTGGFTSLIASVVGPLAGLLLSEMPKLAAHVAARTRTLITPDEYMAAWREVLGKQARHFLLRAA